MLEVELHRIDTVLLFGNVQVSTQALTELLEHGIELALLSLDGRLRGQLTPPLPKNVDLRVGQSIKAADTDFTLKQAREIVTAKIANSLEVLKQADWRSVEPSLAAPRRRLEDAAGEARAAGSLEQLNGVEGAAAHAYFEVFPILMKDNPGLFNGRSRRPPRDPVNAILSLGYTLLASRLQALLDAHGFDPYIGWLHQQVYGRPSLALDLLEPYRAPYVDRFAVKVFNLKIFAADDFTLEAHEGCRFTPPALKRFFAEWEKHVIKHDLRGKMKQHIESVSRVIRGQQEFPDHPRFKAV